MGFDDSIHANLDEFAERQDVEIPEELPLMAVRDVVVFNSMIIPLFVGRSSSVAAVNEALSKDKLLVLLTQKDATNENPGPKDLYEVGMVSMIMRTLKLPDGRLKVLVQALTKVKIKEFLQKEPFFKVLAEVVEEQEVSAITVEVEALMRTVREQTEKIMSLRGILSSDLIMIMNNIDEPGRLADLVASNLRLKIPEAQSILESFDPVAKLKLVAEYLNKELEVSTMQAKIQTEAKEEMTRSQREYYLREQLQALKKELGDVDDRAQEIEELQAKIRRARMPMHAKKEATKQLKRLEMMHPDSSEAGIIRTYLDWLVEVPWSKGSRDRLDLKIAREVLDADHYGLEKVKERILEYLAVRKLNKSTKGPILCFVGPPGVGKTSLGQSIARALGRKFHRISLGGVRDEAEIRGHRRTYVGALPGRIIQGIRRAGSSNPVFMLDEIDKVGSDFRGDPSSALLEVLDPEQNFSFSDHYLDVPFDLSKVMFICTGNVLETIPSALLDRMEVLKLLGYTEDEKVKIANRYLIPRQRKAHGLTAEQIRFSNGAVRQIITGYTREAGLRNMEREIANICRGVAAGVAAEEIKSATIKVGNVSEYLGPIRFISEAKARLTTPGIAMGLAWTPTGGDLLFIEATAMPGKKGLTLTGQLGDVMKESAMAALSFIRSHAKQLKVSDDFFDTHDIHIHVPAGAIPKDGPSAGVTMLSAMVSLLTDKIIKKDLAMTGEITLRGQVLPVGGIKEKVLAAHRAGIKTILMPKWNEKDLVDIPEKVKNDIEFHFMDKMMDVLKLAIP